MDKQLKGLLIFLGLLFIAGGFTAVFQGLDIIWQTICAFFPIFKPVLIQSFADYFSSARFIVSIIIVFCSSAGIYLSARFKKNLYLVLSIIVDSISFVSIVSNLFRCN